MGTSRNKRSARFSKNAKRPVKYKNEDHEHSGHWVTTGHNRGDAEFLAGNKEALQKLQRQND